MRRPLLVYFTPGDRLVILASGDFPQGSICVVKQDSAIFGQIYSAIMWVRCFLTLILITVPNSLIFCDLGQNSRPIQGLEEIQKIPN